MNLEILNWCRSPSSGSRLVGHAEPHAGHCDLRDEQRDLPHFRKVEHASAIIEEISIFTNFSLLSFYIPMVIMVTTYALTIHHLRLFIVVSFYKSLKFRREFPPSSSSSSTSSSSTSSSAPLDFVEQLVHDMSSQRPTVRPSPAFPVAVLQKSELIFSRVTV